jgi:hypothetical protein
MRLELRLAYHVRGKNPLSHFSPADFDLTKPNDFEVACAGCDIAEREPNRLVIRIDQPDFEFWATGFDTRRELFCKPRLDAPAGEANGDSADDGADGDEIIVSADSAASPAGTNNTDGGAL